MNTEIMDAVQFSNCILCEGAGGDERYTHEDWIEHIRVTHPFWRICKGCEELMTKIEDEEGKGWCGLCVYLCLDCMDTEKYPEGP
jgi:hypothetical protein